MDAHFNDRSIPVKHLHFNPSAGEERKTYQSFGSLEKLFLEYTLLQIFEIMLIFSIILLIQNNISLSNSENFLR